MTCRMDGGSARDQRVSARLAKSGALLTGLSATVHRPDARAEAAFGDLNLIWEPETEPENGAGKWELWGPYKRRARWMLGRPGPSASGVTPVMV